MVSFFSLLLAKFTSLTTVSRYKSSELDADDPVRENSNEPFSIEIDPDSTVEDVKRKIHEEYDHNPWQQKLFHGFCDLDDTMKVKEVLEQGSTITSIIDESVISEILRRAHPDDTLNLPMIIVGGREKLEIIPIKPQRGRKLPFSLLSLIKESNKFALVLNKRGENGEIIFICNIYKVKDESELEIKGGKIFECGGAQAVELDVVEQKVFKESELKQGMVSQNMKDVLRWFEKV